MAGWCLKEASLALDSDARIVGNLSAGQRVEQRSLAAVRRTDKGEVPCTYFGRRAHGTTSLR